MDNVLWKRVEVDCGTQQVLLTRDTLAAYTVAFYRQIRTNSDEGCLDGVARGFGDNTLRIRPNVTPRGADTSIGDVERSIGNE
jgi:hypothetical protein